MYLKRSSIDYNKDSEEAYTFFKIVQNKLHYAITGKTAAVLFTKELIAKKYIWDLLVGKIVQMVK